MKNLKPCSLIVILITITTHLFSQTAEEWKKMGNNELESANYAKAIESNEYDYLFMNNFSMNSQALANGVRCIIFISQSVWIGRNMV